MLIMKVGATDEEVKRVIKEIKHYGLKADVSRGEFRTVIGLVGDERKIPFDHFAVLPGVKEVIKIEIPYKLISKEYARAAEGVEYFHKTIQIGNINLGNGEPVIMAGPCAVESAGQLRETAKAVKKAGAWVSRFLLKSSPRENSAFQRSVSAWPVRSR